MNLYNKVKSIAESTLPEKLADYLGTDLEDMKARVKKLTFSEYLNVANSLEKMDDEAIKKQLGESDNPFGSFSKPGEQTKAVDELRPGDELEIPDPEVNPGQDEEDIDATIKSMAGDVVSVQTHRGVERIKKDELEKFMSNDLDEELDEIRKLSGMDSVDETTCAGGIAAVAMPMGKPKKRKKK